MRYQEFKVVPLMEGGMDMVVNWVSDLYPILKEKGINCSKDYLGQLGEPDVAR